MHRGSSGEAALAIGWKVFAGLMLMECWNGGAHWRSTQAG
jgi:hypothetical protein